MKVKCIFGVVLLSICMLLPTLFFNEGTSAHNQLTPNEYLRIHIRANSNNQDDQNIKYTIKDSIVTNLTKLLNGVESKEQAISILKENLDNIQDICDSVLKENNFSYKSKAKIVNENFPTRTYDNITLQSGTYDSLIIYLGQGIGDNWWCVAYPPLCFVGGDNSEDIIYKSKIIDFISNIFGG